MTRQIEPTSVPAIVFSIVALTLCGSCGGGATDMSEDTPGREEFIGVYLDLRTAGLGLETASLEDEVRDSILSGYGVTAQDLLDFVDTHGEDVEFMRDLWTEVETRMTELLEQHARDEENEEIQGGDAGIQP